MPSVLEYTWLGVRKSIQPVKIECGYLSLKRGVDCLHMVQLMSVHPETKSSLVSFKSRLFFLSGTALPGCPGKEAKVVYIATTFRDSCYRLV